MKNGDFTAVVAFFDKVREKIGMEDFWRHKDIILKSTTDIMETWKGQGKDVIELLENENLLLLTALICAAQDTMDALLYSEEEG